MLCAKVCVVTTIGAFWKSSAFYFALLPKILRSGWRQNEDLSYLQKIFSSFCNFSFRSPIYYR